MEDLAVACDVSRRTLFNYFGSKIDAVIGPAPEFPADALTTFRVGGPSGDLVDDLRVLALAAIAQADVSREEAAHHNTLMSDPHLARVVQERFATLTVKVNEEIQEREGAAHDETRTRVAVAALVAVFDLALADFADGTTDDLSERITELIQHMRALLCNSDPSTNAGPTNKEAT